jgi:hypothetical protein
LADAAFTPQRYPDAATRQKDLQRVLFALTEVLLTQVPLWLVAQRRPRWTMIGRGA